MRRDAFRRICMLMQSADVVVYIGVFRHIDVLHRERDRRVRRRIKDHAGQTVGSCPRGKQKSVAAGQLLFSSKQRTNANRDAYVLALKPLTTVVNSCIYTYMSGQETCALFS